MLSENDAYFGLNFAILEFRKREREREMCTWQHGPVSGLLYRQYRSDETGQLLALTN